MSGFFLHEHLYFTISGAEWADLPKNKNKEKYKLQQMVYTIQFLYRRSLKKENDTYIGSLHQHKTPSHMKVSTKMFHTDHQSLSLYLVVPNPASVGLTALLLSPLKQKPHLAKHTTISLHLIHSHQPNLLTTATLIQLLALRPIVCKQYHQLWFKYNNNKK